MLNRARELLYPLDDWDGTVEYGVVCGSDPVSFCLGILKPQELHGRAGILIVLKDIGIEFVMMN